MEELIFPPFEFVAVQMTEQVTFGVVVTTRSFFNSELSKNGKENLLNVLDQKGYDYVTLSEENDQGGLVETREDAENCASLFEDYRDEIDGIIVSLPNFGDEVSVAHTLNEVDLEVPVLVHAFDDDYDDTAELSLDQRRDAFCGKMSVCNNLYQYDIDFTNTTLHTCKVDSRKFKDDLESFGRVCRTVSNLEGARIGQIGARPSSFQTMRYSEKLLQENDITVFTTSLTDIIAKAKGLDDSKEVVDSTLDTIKSWGDIPAEIENNNILKSAKLTVAIKEWIDENNLDAAAIQCWTALENTYGVAPCVSMSILGENGIPIACETDIMGALSMYALYLASDNAPALVDFNNNYYQERDKVVTYHCANFPKSFIDPDWNQHVEISNLDVIGEGEDVDKNDCFGALKSRIVEGEATFSRISTDDKNGEMQVYVGNGQFTDDPFETPGTPGVLEINDLQELMDYICTNGFEHHVAMCRSQVADTIAEALGKYMGWDVYHHN